SPAHGTFRDAGEHPPGTIGVVEVSGQQDRGVVHSRGDLRFIQFWETQWANRATLPARPFSRYQPEREADCVEFQSALLELLRRIPLTCEAERWVTDHWLYFYEC